MARPRIIEKDEKSYLTVSALAQLTGYTVRNIYTLRDKGIIELAQVPSADFEVYDLVKTLTALRQYQGQASVSTSERLNLARIAESEQRERKLRAQADIACGNSYPAECVELVVGDLLAAFRSRIRSMPGVWAVKLAGMHTQHEVQTALGTAVDECLTVLSTYNRTDFLRRNPEYIGQFEAAQADESEEEADEIEAGEEE